MGEGNLKKSSFANVYMYIFGAFRAEYSAAEAPSLQILRPCMPQLSSSSLKFTDLRFYYERPLFRVYMHAYIHFIVFNSGTMIHNCYKLLTYYIRLDETHSLASSCAEVGYTKTLNRESRWRIINGQSKIQ